MTDPTRHVALLAMVAGVGRALSNASDRSLGDQLGLPAVLMLALVLGPVGGLLGLYLASALLRWTGSWLGGQASSEQVRAAYAWSSVPAIWLLPLWIAKLVIFGRQLFMDADFASETHWAIFGLFTLIELVVGIWATVVLLKCLGEVQGFSAWKALGSVLLAFLVVFVPIVLLIMLITLVGS
jgi:hypothetical protein